MLSRAEILQIFGVFFWKILKTKIYSEITLPLKSVCHELKAFGNKAMLYLAAAVSDFYIPNQVR